MIYNMRIRVNNFKIINNYMEKEKFSLLKVTNNSLNFGPQHPAAHGVLRLVLERW